ncbi:hypothetical protein ACFL02_01635, partial [Planctomycetota bacterium]
MKEERKLVKDFFEEYNRHTACHWNVRFEVIDCENYASVGIGRPQEIIIRQTLDRYSNELILFIGLMGQKFGSPTGISESGTKEEYEWVMKHYEDNEFPEIKFFFRNIKYFTSPPEPEIIKEAAEQWKKVLDFRKQIKENHLIFCGDFPDTESFPDIFRNDLSQWLSDPSRPWFKPPFEYGKDITPPTKPDIMPQKVDLLHSKDEMIIRKAVEHEIVIKESTELSDDDFIKLNYLNLSGADIENISILKKFIKL